MTRAYHPCSPSHAPCFIYFFLISPQIVVGVLLKYVGLGWRPRLFVLQDGVLKYYKVYGPTAVNVSQILDALRQQGEVFPIGAEVSLLENQDARTAPSPGVRDALSSFSSPFAAVAIPPARMEIHMQVGSVRESNADGRKFYVHSGTTILTLRAETQYVFLFFSFFLQPFF